MKLLMGIVLLAGIICLIRSFWERHHFKVEEYEIKTDKIQKGKKYTFVFLSDLHNASFGKENQKLIEKLDMIRPDGILLGGDMLIGCKNPLWDNAISLLGPLSKTYPIFYGIGNHEYRMKLYLEEYGDSYEKYCDILKKYKLHIMCNESVQWKQDLWIHGLELEAEYYKRFEKMVLTKEKMEDYLGEKEKNGFHILIAHNPAYLDGYGDWGADLVLSGHNHGGIVILPGLGGVISTQFTLFPKFDWGIFSKNHTKLILSRGLGTHTIPFRLGNIPEITVIHIEGTISEDKKVS